MRKNTKKPTVTLRSLSRQLEELHDKVNRLTLAVLEPVEPYCEDSGIRIESPPRTINIPSIWVETKPYQWPDYELEEIELTDEDLYSVDTPNYMIPYYNFVASNVANTP
jgi:hypothetical protein